MQLKSQSPKVTNLVIGAIKRVWHRNPTRLAVLARVRAEEPRYKKDGSLAVKPQVFYLCEQCGAKAKPAKSADYPVIHVDHIDPVVPVTRTLKELSWDEYIARLFCEIENLQALCGPCHHTKTQAELKVRKRKLK